MTSHTWHRGMSPRVIEATASAGGSFNVFRATDPGANPAPAVAVSAVPSPAASDAGAESEPTSDPLDVLNIWSDIISAVEAVVDSHQTVSPLENMGLQSRYRDTAATAQQTDLDHRPAVEVLHDHTKRNAPSVRQ